MVGGICIVSFKRSYIFIQESGCIFLVNGRTKSIPNFQKIKMVTYKYYQDGYEWTLPGGRI